MLKKITLTFFIALFAFISQANAQTAISPEKQAVIKELLALVNADNKSEDMMNLFVAQMETMREKTIDAVLDERTDLTAEERKALRETLITSQKEAAKRFHEKLMQKLNFDEMIDEIATIVYDKYYTVDEIKDLIAFYKTPTGQKMLKTMTPLMADTLILTTERLAPKIPIIFKEIQDEEKREIERVVNAKKPKGKKSASR